MKKKILSIALCVIMIIIVFSGCAKCVNTQIITDDVKIVDIYYRCAYNQPIYINKHYTFIYHPEVTEVIVSYKNEKYTLDNKQLYKKYKDSKGETIKAQIEKKTYDNGRVTYNIIDLE